MNVQKVINIAKYAYNMVPFYVNKIDGNDDLKRIINGDVSDESLLTMLPVVDKNQVINEGNLYSAEYAFGRNQELDRVRTSGSTGKCMDIVWNRKDNVRSMLPLWMARLRYYGVGMNERYCYFYTSANSDEHYIGNTAYEYVGNSLGFSKSNLSESGVKRIYELISEYKPAWINMQPSIAFIFAGYLKKNNLSGIDSVKYIEFTGEMLSEAVRIQTEEIFHCKTANQYGCYETNSIAYECPEGNMHCMDNTYVEITDNEGNNVGYEVEGNITITNMENHAMPFIRYKTGDIGALYRNHSCKCGNHSPILKLTSGRISDYAVTENGVKINAYVFVKAVSEINNRYNFAIQQFQILQTSYSNFVVKFVLNKDMPEIYANKGVLEYEFMDSIDEESIINASYSFEYYDELLPDEDNGKLRYFKRVF